MLQETKMRRKNKIKISNYVIFEHIRKEKCGGGLLTAIHENLKPVSVSVDDESEILVVEAELGQEKVRFINAYGPQECANENSKEKFYQKLDEEVKSSKLAGKMICIELDANAKLGCEMIRGDPHPQSKNGKYLAEFIENNNLAVLNGSSLCQGTITRKRVTVNSTEESVIDYFIVCTLLLERVKSMKIDEEQVHCLTKYSTKNGIKSLKPSDHNLLTLTLDMSWSLITKKGKIRTEMFNYANPGDFSKYRHVTENCKELVHCLLDSIDDVEIASQKWLKAFTRILHKCFKKIRIKDTKNPDYIEQLLDRKDQLNIERNNAFQNEDAVKIDDLDKEIFDINDIISSTCAEKNAKIIDDFLKHAGDGIDGYSQPKTWKMLNVLAPKKCLEAPAAKLDSNGNLVSDLHSLQTLYIDTYKTRLKPNNMKDGLKDLEKLKNYLFELRCRLAKNSSSHDWTILDLENALKSFKNKKARDSLGHSYELFKYGGRDLKKSLVLLFNLIKKQQVYPKFLQSSNISSFYKNKGSRNDLDNDRGVFNVVKIRSILDKMIYNDKYDIIDENMSCSNIGARKNRNIRDHLFVINGILNDMKQKKAKDIDIQIYDVRKCFDKLWYQETANDLYEAGVTDDKFITIANSNSNCDVAVKIPGGAITERFSLKNIEMQGTVLSSLKCSVSIDTLGKECLQTGDGLFKYKDCLSIPPLSMVDDVLGVASCGTDSVKLNSIIQAKMNTKNLEMGQNKCFKLHVGNKSKTFCPKLSVDDEEMKTSNSEVYLGNIITDDCKINENIEARYKKGVGAVSSIFSYLREIPFGHDHFRIALLLRSSIMINSVLSSCEVLYGIKKYHIDILEKCDKLFFSQLFGVPKSCPYEAFFMETDSLPIRHVLIGRRLMYYWSILHKPNTELARQFYETQKNYPCNDDWTHQIEKDLSDCEINMSEEDISKMSWQRFKNLVKQRLKVNASIFLCSLKEQHSKLQNLNSYSFQDYLQTNELSIEQKKLLFSLRCRMTPTKSNYKNNFKENMSCRICQVEDSIESDQHLLTCRQVISVLKDSTNILKVKYEDIFDNLSSQIEITKIYEIVIPIINDAPPPVGGLSLT